MGAGPIFLTVLCLVGAQVFANTGEQVVVVYNNRIPASKKVAEHYAAKRNVPTNQIVSFFLPEDETISRDEFENNLQKPLWKELTERKLFTLRENPNLNSPTPECNVVEASIRYLVLCYGVPLKIAPDASLKEPQGEKVQAELRRNE